MTTVAWDGRTLAADSMGDQNGLYMPTTKLHRGLLADGTPFLFGGAGETSWCRRLHAFIKTLKVDEVDGAIYPHQVNDGPERNDPACILALGRYGTFYKAGGMLIRLERKYYAIGSGRDFAIAAMHLGKSASEAVAVACEFDCYSGGEVRCMELAK